VEDGCVGHEEREELGACAVANVVFGKTGTNVVDPQFWPREDLQGAAFRPRLSQQAISIVPGWC